MKLNYTEGTWFAVALTGGGFGIGVLEQLGGLQAHGYGKGPEVK